MHIGGAHGPSLALALRVVFQLAAAPRRDATGLLGTAASNTVLHMVNAVTQRLATQAPLEEGPYMHIVADASASVQFLCAEAMVPLAAYVDGVEDTTARAVEVLHAGGGVGGQEGRRKGKE